MRQFPRSYRRCALVLLLLLLLLPALGFQEGPTSDADEARRVARLAPKVDELLSHPTVEAAARYDSASDSWLVVLTERTSGTRIARVAVADDAPRVQGIRIFARAGTLDYPSISADEAVELALANEEVRSELAEHGNYRTTVDYQNGLWTVRFEVEEGGSASGTAIGGGRKEVARVGVEDASLRLDYVWTGDQIDSKMARNENNRGEPYGGPAGAWYVWAPLALLFALAFWRTDKLYSLRNLDVLVLLSFLISNGFIRADQDLYWAVLLWYPPLLYLLVRTLLMGFGIGERVEKTSNFSAPVLLGFGTLASVLVLALIPYSYVIDVGLASLAGAELILNGALPYGNMPSEAGISNGDTYGPLNYLLYLPFVWAFGDWGYEQVAHLVTALAFIAAALALFAAGRRYAGKGGGAAMLFAWAVYPYTVYSTNNNTNDVLVAAVLAIGLAMAASPWARGASVAAGFAIKLFPLALGPLWLMHDGRRRAPFLGFILGGAAVLVLSFWVLALGGDPAGALGLFYERTAGFQGERESSWSIFAQVPELAFLQRPLVVATVLLGFLVAFVPKKRTVRRLAAFSAAIAIAFQLMLTYWVYFYIVWFEPFVFLALLLATNEKTALDGEAGGERPAAEDRQETGQEPSKPQAGAPQNSS